jgi:hypothetical protein
MRNVKVNHGAMSGLGVLSPFHSLAVGAILERADARDYS